MRAGYRWGLFAGLLLASVALSVGLSLLLQRWVFLGLLLLVPLFGRGLLWGTRSAGPPVREPWSCATCGYVQRDASEAFCPREGHRLGPPGGRP